MTRTISLKPSIARALALTAAAAALVGCLASPAAADDCNPFTLLFGGCRQEAPRTIVAPAPVDLRVTRPAVAKHAQSAVKKAAPRHAGIKHERANTTSIVAKAPIGSLAAFAQDPTLRSGDIVVTTQGFRVYRDRAFAPIAHDGGALAALEKASLRPQSSDFAAKVAPSKVVEATPVRPAGIVALRATLRLASRE